MFQKVYLWVENMLMSSLVGKGSPGPVFRWIFKIPVLLYRLRLGKLVGKRFLLLTTTGRKTGKLRSTPLEYSYDPTSNSYLVMAGWGGKTDWYRNARHNPRLRVQIEQRVFDVLAEPVPQEEVAQTMLEITRLNPGMMKVWQRWSDQPLDGTLSSWRQAARYFPCLRLRELQPGETADSSVNEETNHDPAKK